MITTLLLIIIYLSFISLGLPDSLIGSAWPSMYQGLNVPMNFAGYASMISATGTIISSILSVRVIRRFGTGIVTAVSVLMTAAALIGISLSRNFLFLCLFSIPLGLGAGSVDAGLNNYVAVNYKARHMSWLHCFWGVGASLGPLIMAHYLINNFSWHFGFRTVGIIQFCLVAILFISLPLWKKAGINVKKIDDSLGSQEARSTQEKHEPVNYAKILKIKGVKYALLAFFCYCTIEMITGFWGASFLVTEKNIQPEIAARWIALFYIGITAGRFISGFFTMKFTNKQMVRIGQVIITCGIIVLFLPFDNFLLLPALFLIGLGCAPIFPSLLHETPKNFGENDSQAIMGIQMASAYIGITFMPPLFGQIAKYIGFGFFPFFIALILIIKIFMTELLNRRVKKSK